MARVQVNASRVLPTFFFQKKENEKRKEMKNEKIYEKNMKIKMKRQKMKNRLYLYLFNYKANMKWTKKERNTGNT